MKKSDEADAILAQMQARVHLAVFASDDLVDESETKQRFGFSARQLIGWEREGEIFVIRGDSNSWFPLYMFNKDGPLPAISEIIHTFQGWGPMSLALWFLSPHGYLGGRRPKDVVAKEPDLVMAAARASATLVQHG